MATPSRLHRRIETDARVIELARGQAMQAAIERLNAGRLHEAEHIARVHLSRAPRDVAALCLLGDLAARSGVHGEAERMFRRALDVLPSFTEAQLNLAKLLSLRDGIAEAIAILGDILEDLPDRKDIALLRLGLLSQIGDYATAAEGYANLLRRHPECPAVWLANGHLQNTIGDAAASILSYRRAITIEPDYAEAWWGLANLKTFRFNVEEITQLSGMVGALGDQPSQRAGLLHFAYAKALADDTDHSGSFAHFARANAICHRAFGDDGRETSAEVDRSIAFFGGTRSAAWAGAGHPSRDPIFVLGMPRSGSTLVEQILASHPLIEGTSELPYIPMLVHRLLAERWTERDLRFPEVMDAVPAERWRELGQTYLDAAALHRREGRPIFIDKLPNNWRYIGFIRAILPNARIIDTRREAMACLWSNYRQWFARGQDWSYDFDSLARTWHDYLRLTEHFDRIAPGAVIRCDHSALRADPEGEIRSLLKQLDLPFAETCLRFYDNDRPVRTASAQQVRRPIEAVPSDEWRRFERWLDPLKDALARFGYDVRSDRISDGMLDR